MQMGGNEFIQIGGNEFIQTGGNEFIQTGGNELTLFNAIPVRGERTFYIYTTGMDYDKSLERWTHYIRNNIIDNILTSYDRIIIHHSDVMFYIDNEEEKIEKLFSYERFIQNDIENRKVHSSTFTYMPLNFQELHERHSGRNYIILDCAHVVQYVFPADKYDNMVYLQYYGEDPTTPFYLNSVYFGVIGNEGDHYNDLIMTNKLFKVVDGEVTTYIKTLFDNHRYLFTRNELYINLPQLVYEPILTRCKRALEAEWRTRYGGLFNKINHMTYSLGDFDDIYTHVLKDNSPIILILNLYLEDEALNEDTIYGITMDNIREPVHRRYIFWRSQ